MDYVNQPPLAFFYSSSHSYRLKERGRESEFDRSEKENESGKESRRGRTEQREVEEKHDEGNKCDVTKTIKTSAKQREETRRRLN